MDSCSIVYDIFRADQVRGVSVSPFKFSASESAFRDGCRLHGITVSPDWDSRGCSKELLARLLAGSCAAQVEIDQDGPLCERIACTVIRKGLPLPMRIVCATLS